MGDLFKASLRVTVRPTLALAFTSPVIFVAGDFQ